MLSALLLSLALVAAPSDSPEWEGLAVVEPVVRSELARRWNVDAGQLVLDWGLVRESWVPGREAHIELNGTGRGGYWIVGVEDGDNSLAIRLRAGTQAAERVAARDLPRGHTLSPADWTLVTQPVWGAPRAASAAVEEGWTVRRPIRAGEVLGSPQVGPPDAVRSGSPVTVEYVRGPVVLTLPGTALGTVPVGGAVNVRTETGERLRGEAVAPGRVRVSPSF
jgi:flagella basal body P-ring formation protein FlgA